MQKGPRTKLSREDLTAALKRHNNKVRPVAEEAGVTTQAVYLAIKAYSIRRPKVSRKERSAIIKAWWERRKATSAA